MKKLLFIIVISLFTTSLFSQENKEYEIQTLLGKNISHGGYLGLTMGYTQINGTDALNAGGRLGWVINHRLVIGIAGNGFANSRYYYNSYMQSETMIEGGYGGLFIEPVIGSRLPVHLSFPILFGAGGLSYNKSYYDGADPWESYTYEEDAFALIEPGVEVELNLMKFFRIGVGASYRYTTDIHLQNNKSEMLNGISGNVSLKFGKF